MKSKKPLLHYRNSIPALRCVEPVGVGVEHCADGLAGSGASEPQEDSVQLLMSVFQYRVVLVARSTSVFVTPARTNATLAPKRTHFIPYFLN